MTQAVEERSTKRPRVEVQNSTIELTISLATSGKIVAKLQVPSESSVAQLKRSLEEHIEAGTVVKKLFKGGTLLKDKRSLRATGLANGAEINAIVGSKPVLFSKDPTEDFHHFWVNENDSYSEDESDDEDSLSEGDTPASSDSLSEGDTPAVVRDEDSLSEGDTPSSSDSLSEEDTPEVVRKGMEEAPTVAREVAIAMLAAAPRLGEAFGRPQGQVIVIGHQGEDPKKACLEVFEQCSASHERRAECREEDWSKHMRGGFIRKADGNFPVDEDDLGDVWHFEDHTQEILAITKIMSEKLDKHFSFSFSPMTPSGSKPIFNGGYSSDGSIVGFLGRPPW